VNKEEARRIAEEYIANELQPMFAFELAISVLKEFETCWIAVYNYRDYIENKENRRKIIGNSPLIINKRTGVLRRGVSRLPIEKQVDGA